MTIEELLQAAAASLSTVSDSPRLDAEILLATVLHVSRTQLRIRQDAQLQADQQQQFMTMIARRMQREPIAYITGHKEFWSLNLKVDQATLIPRPDTELIIETVLSLFAEDTRIRVADLGTGSGAIALALASERPQWEIDAVDNSESALKIAGENAQELGLKNIAFHCGDWFTALPGCKFELVVTNPPYLSASEWPEYAASLAYEPQSALVSGDDGLHDIRKICAAAATHIIAGGYLLIEHGYAQGAAVRSLLSSSGAKEVRTLKDLAGKDRVTLGRY